MLITDKHMKEIKDMALLIYNETGITYRNADSFLALCYLKANIRFCVKHNIEIRDIKFDLPSKPKQID